MLPDADLFLVEIVALQQSDTLFGDSEIPAAVTRAASGPRLRGFASPRPEWHEF
jgi:hypothetical protein